MKKTILLSALILFAAFSFAQTKFAIGEAKPVITLKNDTLYVPVGTCKYIKIGDKVYYVNVTLEEVQEPQGFFLAPPSFKYPDSGFNYSPYVAEPDSTHWIHPLGGSIKLINPNQNQ